MGMAQAAILLKPILTPNNNASPFSAMVMDQVVCQIIQPRAMAMALVEIKPKAMATVLVEIKRPAS